MQVTPERTALGHQDLGSAFLNASTTTPALDAAVFLGLSELLERSVLAQIYHEFLNGTRARLQALAAVPEPTTLKNTGHTIKGTAGMLGARALADCAAQLEQASTAGKQARRLIRRMLHHCDSLEAELKFRQVTV